MEQISLYTTQINNLISENGLDDNFGAVVRNCTNMKEIFQALSDRTAKHVAVLTRDGKPIENMFGYIKDQLAESQPVALALFFEKD